MKHIVLGDLHAGEKDGNRILMSHQLDYLGTVLEYCKTNNISSIILTGDVFDVRKSTATEVLFHWKNRFFNVAQEMNIQITTIVGNHDAVFRDTLTPNAIVENLSDYNNIQVFSEPSYFNLGGLGEPECNMLMVPWICKDNHDSCIGRIQESKAKYCMGHFEIKGATMQAGQSCKDGLSVGGFKHFDKVFSGHFHSRGRVGDSNIEYVGTPYQMCWADYADPKGFHILDSLDGSLEFIQSEMFMFHKFIYDEAKDMDSQLKLVDLTDKYVKVVVEVREDFKKYEKWLVELESMGITKLSIVEPYIDRTAADTDVEAEMDENLNVASTVDLMVEYITSNYPERKDGMIKMMTSIYSESIKL